MRRELLENEFLDTRRHTFLIICFNYIIDNMFRLHRCFPLTFSKEHPSYYFSCFDTICFSRNKVFFNWLLSQLVKELRDVLKNKRPIFIADKVTRLIREISSEQLNFKGV